MESGRIELQRRDLTEWYRFDERGVEQGFTIPGPAAAGPAGSPLVLEIRLSGPLANRAVQVDGAIAFSDSHGVAMLRYEGLKVSDARGAALEASLSLRPGVVRISIQDAGAAYPLTVDPLLSTPAWTSSFGSAVAGAGDVNGDGYDDVLVASFGTAYLYLGSEDGLSKDATWNSPFGTLVTGAGDVNGDGYDDVLVSSFYFGEGPYLFLGSSSGLSAVSDWTPEATPDTPEVRSIASAGDVNGDGFDDLAIASSNGFVTSAVRVYLGSADGPGLVPAWSITQTDPYTALGYSVAGAGDVNGDGFADLIVGEPLYGVTEPFEAPATGRARLYLGSASGLDDNPAWVTERLVQFGWLGSSVASAGDLNGDGFADLVVGGINGYRGTEPGVVEAFLGSSSGPGVVPALDAVGDGYLTHLGAAVASAGDVNGDGFDDLLAGEPDYDLDIDTESVGRAYLFAGAPGGVTASPVWTAQGEHPFQSVGVSVASAGDVNGDGYADILIGSFEGAVLYLGARDNHAPVAQAVAAAQTECTSPAGATVLLDGSISTDADSTPGTHDDITTYEWFESFGTPDQALVASGMTASPTLGRGSHALTLRVTDKAGASGTQALPVTVTDTRAPSLSVELSRETLWPPNRRMVPVHVSVSATDVCGAPAVVLSAILNNEADDAPGDLDGATLEDIQGAAPGTADFDFMLRAERSDSGDGRIYTVVYQATDGAGNSTTLARKVTVPLHRIGNSAKRTHGSSRPQAVDGSTR